MCLPRDSVPTLLSKTKLNSNPSESATLGRLQLNTSRLHEKCPGVSLPRAIRAPENQSEKHKKRGTVLFPCLEAFEFFYYS